ncbi:4-(cytidine 5'-diphospho)-2-C-methyl-D-erythritol kinase [Sedimentitalea nanhaiensis]|uniref:4-diphosphocytidyl-2-C-methyl-D-erythritol kinase n=1 Tax=Sedimentitalea nanhaiensis TaxID=999627 RepID=A0A1I6XLY4_9RHOB|nr:4-(cytidine 5'-diphospho)-2-C-methyl-D-erythritol kinase [Sedimentitalea nanhaiensis]SFT39290.1 4-diphosphocytidyl-2-C-methyl-D-erythritol kinase [Sedimentitalea nanhaiensis]
MTAAEPCADAVQEFAPAKINLTLHVTGQRPDGYHLLDSLVVFADVGDRIAVRRADRMRFKVTGPMAAGVPVDDSNLVLRAAHAAGVTRAEITLDKHLPAASGIGGGSSDAAAVLRALTRSHKVRPLSGGRLLRLGADVPVCLAATTARMSGIGERLAPVAGFPSLAAVLINPGVQVHTPDAFRALMIKNGAAMPSIPDFADTAACCDWLAAQRNDLQAPVVNMVPVVGVVLDALENQGAVLARMSGSGATCFGLFDSLATATAAARALTEARLGWWIRATTLAPRLSRPA